ncbi:hypothetical protein GA0115255_102512, partial [Streptomyces sp. Ncost-T6T-2b]
MSPACCSLSSQIPATPFGQDPDRLV